MSDLDLIDWHRVARAVLTAEEDRRVAQRGNRYEETSDAAKRVALESIDLYHDRKKLTVAGFQYIGGMWCRIEDGKIAPYTREAAFRRLEKESNA